jgi:hypothetical protein
MKQKLLLLMFSLFAVFSSKDEEPLQQGIQQDEKRIETTSNILKFDIWKTVETYSEARQSVKLKMMVSGLKKLKNRGVRDLYPNDSDMKLLLFDNNEIIWENAHERLESHRMEAIEDFSRAERGRRSSSRFFKDISKWNDRLGNGHILDAAAREFGKAFVLAMSEHVDPNESYCGRTPLMVAAQFGAQKAVLKLINRGANVEANCGRWRSIHFAAYGGSASYVKVLLENKANIDVEDRRAQTPLLLAGKYGHLDALNVLLQFGASTKINIYGKYYSAAKAMVHDQAGVLKQDQERCKQATEAYEEKLEREKSANKTLFKKILSLF